MAKKCRAPSVKFREKEEASGVNLRDSQAEASTTAGTIRRESALVRRAESCSMRVERGWDESCSVQMAVRANVVASTALISTGKESIVPAAVADDVLPIVAEMTPGILW